ncbi:kelch-like protein 32 [Amphiura filiformis]|uniref:kelch-like protein 32 n=1 Tax=Amphiura filiformis TaxID=82378 RepID=UPI003B21F570
MATNHKRGYFDRSETDRHRCSVLGMLDFLREDDKLCDVTITVEDKKFRAHKNVLSSSSDYFYSMFTSDFQEKNLDEIELEGRSESFKRLLGYAYTGDMEIDDLSTDDAIDLLNMAAYLQLKHAVKLLSQVLLRALECGFANLAEMYRIWELADLLAKGMCIDELATTALDLLAKHFIEFSQLELFNSDVSSAFLEKCLKRNSVAAIVPEDEGEQKDGKKEKAAKGECKKMRKLVKEMNLEGITEEVLEERFKEKRR